MKKKDNGTYHKPSLGMFTDWGDPKERFKSQYGTLTYREWCEKEIERIGKGRTVKVSFSGGKTVFLEGKKVVILTAEDGEIALKEVHDAREDQNNLQQDSVG